MEFIFRTYWKSALRKGTCALQFNPVLCGTAFKYKGIQKLLDAVVDYLPSPLDIPAITGINPETNQEETREASDDVPFSALAFKIMTDPYMGQFRIIQG